MTDFDFLNDYNNKELAEMIPVIEKLIKKNEKAEKSALKQQIAALAADSGYSIDEILGGKTGVKAKRTVKPKYQNPADGATWTGRGRKPKWVVELEENGGNIEDCAL